MAEDFVELGAEGINYLTDKHWDKGYDAVSGGFQRVRNSLPGVRKSQTWGPNTAAGAAAGGATGAAAASAVSSGRPRKQRNQLPSPQRGQDYVERYQRKENYRDFDGAPPERDLDKQSQFSEEVCKSYEADPRDPTRRVETVLPEKDLRKLRRDSRMSYANGYAPSQGGRPHSAAPPRSRYYDEDEESDYDERTGRRYSARGRGYDDGYDDDRDRDYDREVVTTERYRGPYRGDFERRQSFGNRSAGNDPYGAGAVTQYRRSTNDLDEYRSRRSRSRGSRRDREERDRSYSRSRSGSRDRGFKEKIEDHFDLSAKGLGAGLAGAVVGGMIGRNVGRNSRHQQRDLILGAVIGGLGANAAETKWSHWKEDKKEHLERDEDRWEQKWDGYDRRSRSAMR